MAKLNEILGKIAELLQTDLDTNKLIGKEFKFGEFTCIPILSVGLIQPKEEVPKKTILGKSAKKENAKEEASVYPIGFLVTRKESIFFVPAFTVKGLREEIEIIPDVIEKFRTISRKKTAKV